MKLTRLSIVFYTQSLQNPKLSKCSKMFCLRTKRLVLKYQMFVGDLKTGDSMYPMLTIISEESRKLTYLKLPQLWIIKAFLSTEDEHVRLKFSKAKQRRKDHNYINISDYIQQIKLSDPVQSISKSYEHGLFKHRSSQEETSHCSNNKYTTPNFVKTKWSEDLPTESYILEDFTPVHLWRPHFGGDC